jgi:hypothetical protein
MYTSKSAPLPLRYKWCEGTDPNAVGNNIWFQWKPRIINPKYIGAERICYWEDRGQSKNINDFERD